MTTLQNVVARHTRQKQSYLAPHQVSYFMRKLPTYIQQKYKQRAKSSIDVAKDALSAVIDVTLPDGSFIEVDMIFPADPGAEYIENMVVMAYPKGGRGTRTMQQKNLPFRKLVPSDIIDGAMQELTQGKTARIAWKGKILGRDARLQWSGELFLLEELPQKGKRKLRVGRFDHASDRMNIWSKRGGYLFIPENILQDAKIGSGDNYDAMARKIEKAWDTALKKFQEIDSEFYEKHDWLRKQKWYVDQVYFLEVTPEGTDPFTAQGKDFTVKVQWKSFSAYDPSSDFQSMDPTYTQYESKSPAAARKFYKILKAEPDALKNVSWGDFRKWLSVKKIPFRTNFSVYR